MKNGFIKTAACSPALRVADCNYNAEKIIEAMQAHANVQLLVFPEFSLTGYTCGDLFLQHTLLQGAEAALEKVIAASEGLNQVAVVGLPFAVNGKLYNCAPMVSGGALLGLVPKT